MKQVYLYSPRYVPPPPRPQTFFPFHMTWTGWNGTVVPLTDPGPDASTGAMLVNTGLRGLAMPPIQRYTSTSPAIAGSRYLGSSVDERDAHWNLYVYSETGSKEWMEYDRALWRTLDPTRTGTWTVTHPDGETRTLQCRLVDDDNHAFDHDPSAFGWSLYSINLVAEQPFWAGEKITREWGSGGSIPFFNGNSAPLFYISRGATYDSATLTNPGDVDAYPIWHLKGPFTVGYVGVGTRLIRIPFGLQVGEELVIDTRPDHQSAYTSAGVRRTGDLSEADFAPIPSGEDVNLNIAIVGNGSISVELTPLYYRAW